MQKKRIAEANKAIGKPKVGGSFNLVDQNGKPYTDADMKGRYSLVSFIRARPNEDMECIKVLTQFLLY